jgi:hypothetical protein
VHSNRLKNLGCFLYFNPKSKNILMGDALVLHLPSISVLGNFHIQNVTQDR